MGFFIGIACFAGGIIVAWACHCVCGVKASDVREWRELFAEMRERRDTLERKLAAQEVYSEKLKARLDTIADLSCDEVVL